MLINDRALLHFGRGPAREHDRRTASSTPDGGRGSREVCIVATGRHAPSQDMIGPDRTKPPDTAAMTGYGNAQRLVAGWTTQLFWQQANRHPTDTREVCVEKSMPHWSTMGPGRHSGPLRPDGSHAACQKPEKPPVNEHQQMHRLIDSQHAGWLLLLNTEFVDNSFRTVFRLRFPHGPPKTLVVQSFLV